MKAIVIEESHWNEIFDAWLREVKEKASDHIHIEDRNWSHFLQYHAHELKRRVEEAR